MSNNPLQGYFRQPSIHLTLPSNGEFYSPETLVMPTTGELPVYPMTAIDEMTYRTPDALFNGSALVSVVKSCVPSIIDPWGMSADDITAVLTAIRIASLGHDMELDTTCPKCLETDTYELDLRHVLDAQKAPDYSKPFELGDLQVYFKPLTYKDVNENSKINFEEERLKQLLLDDSIEEDSKMKMLSEAFRKVNNFTLETIVKNINKIVIPNAEVQEPKYIMEFLQNTDRETYEGIKKHVISNRVQTNLKPVHIKCDSCEHEYEQPFTMDMSSFFE